MKAKNWTRIIIYIALFVVFVIAVQVKKAWVTESRQQKVVSIPSEIQKHGWPVDVEKVEKQPLYDSVRVTVVPTSKEKQMVSFYFSRNERAQFKKNQKVLSIEDSKAIGHIVDVDKSPEFSTGLYKAHVKIDKPENFKEQNLKNVDVVIKDLKSTFSVPIEAVDNFYQEDKTYVWSAKNGVAKPIPVELGLSGHNRVEVTKGLSEGDFIVINGYQALKDGVNLRIRKCDKCEHGQSEVSL